MSSSSVITTDIEHAAYLLNTGGVIGMPTETVYGLAARADMEESVGRIFDIKGRPRNHPLIAHLSPDAPASAWGHLNSNAETLAAAFWPGPITLLVPRTERIGLWVTGGRENVALRVPSLNVTQRLLRMVDDAVVAPSANLYGKVSPTTAQHVLSDLGASVDCILDGGPSSVGLESTIVECVGESISILRPGGISAQQIADATGLPLNFSAGESRAPGMMLSHYAPEATLILVDSVEQAMQFAADRQLSKSDWAMLHFDDADEYALKMYDQLRQFDSIGISLVIATLPQARGIGEAVRDRLQKAAAPKS
jgi:L-threonylcarbamoyladenylate synthase